MPRKISIYLKVIYAIFMAILIPCYWFNYGPANFLWISDVTLILTFFAVIFENQLLASMAAVGGLALELFWTVCFIPALLFNIHISNLADYMFDATLPLWLRMLSLFHLALPPLLIWLVMRLGYFKKALVIQIFLISVVLVLSSIFSTPTANINWVYSYKYLSLNPILYRILEGIGCCLILLISHQFLLKLGFRKKQLPVFE